MRIEYTSERVKISLDRTVHRFLTSSAIGKSAFARIAKEDKTCNVVVLALDRLSDYLRVDEYLKFDPSNTIWVFDRFDMFASDYLWSILRSSKDRCILVDCKYCWQYDLCVPRANVDLTAEDVYVYDK